MLAEQRAGYACIGRDFALAARHLAQQAPIPHHGLHIARAARPAAQSGRAHHTSAARLVPGSLTWHFGSHARKCVNHVCVACHAAGQRHPRHVAASSSKRGCGNTPASPRLTIRPSRPCFTAANFSGMFVLDCRRAAGRLNSGVRCLWTQRRSSKQRYTRF